MCPFGAGNKQMTYIQGFRIEREKLLASSLPIYAKSLSESQDIYKNCLWLKKTFRYGSVNHSIEIVDSDRSVRLNNVFRKLAMPIYIEAINNFKFEVYQPLVRFRPLCAEDLKKEHFQRFLDDLALIHATGVAHGDIKWVNVGITEDSKVHLFDWEPFLILRTQNRYQIRSTIYAIAPSDRKAKLVTPKSDWYAIASLYVRLVYGLQKMLQIAHSTSHSVRLEAMIISNYADGITKFIDNIDTQLEKVLVFN